MIENPSVKELEDLLKDVINAHIDAEGISLAELVGVLECIKQEFISQANDEDKEDDE